MRWRIEQAEEFRDEVERYTDAEQVILADAYQARVPRSGGNEGVVVNLSDMLGAGR